MTGWSLRYVEMTRRPGEHSHGPDARLVQCDPDERCLLGHSENQKDRDSQLSHAESVIPDGSWGSNHDWNGAKCHQWECLDWRWLKMIKDDCTIPGYPRFCLWLVDLQHGHHIFVSSFRPGVIAMFRLWVKAWEPSITTSPMPPCTTRSWRLSQPQKQKVVPGSWSWQVAGDLAMSVCVTKWNTKNYTKDIKYMQRQLQCHLICIGWGTLL